MAEPAASEPSWSRRTFASLRHKTYRRFFLGHGVSLTGFWMRIAAQGWLVWEITGSKRDLGFVTALGLLPFVVLAPFGGTLADRHDRRGLLMRTQAVAAVVNLALAAVVLLGHAVLWQVAAAAVVVGAARAVEIPVRQALVEDLVGPEDRSNAIALNAAAFQLAQVVGPMIAGALSVLGTGPCFALVSLCAAFNVFLIPGIEVAEKEHAAGTGGTWRQVREGFGFVLGHRRIRTLLLLIAIAFLFLYPYRTFLPAVADDVLGWGSLGYGVLLTATGTGALLGALWVAGRAHLPASRPVVFGLVWASSVVVAAIGTLHTPFAILPLLVVAGFCQVAFVATANTMVQSSAPANLRGRVMGIWTLVFGASFPAGSALMGLAAEHWSMSVAFAWGAGFTLLLTLGVRFAMPPRESARAPTVEDVAAPDVES